jgi:hypothetical protein
MSRTVSFLLTICLLNMVSDTVLAQEKPTPDQPRGPVGATDGPDRKSSSAAGAWRTSFGSDATLTYFRRGGDAAVIVVAAGELAESENAEVELAADTLEAALRESDEFHFVMNDDALADNTAVDDARIIDKAKHLPVGQVAVVRVYAGAAGKPPTAVVTVYNKDTKEAATALSVTRGEDPRPSNRPPADSAPKESVEARADKEAAERGEDAAAETVETAAHAADPKRKEYFTRYIWFEEEGSDAVLSQWTRVYLGDQKESLEGEAFYREVGRPDLADEYSTHTVIKWSTVASLAALGAGSAALIAFSGKPGDPGRAALAGAAGGGLFLSAALVGMLYNPHPIELDAAKQLAGEHNAEIRDELGLPAEAREQAQAVDWSLGVSPNGVSVRVGF